MELWYKWFELVNQFAESCSRKRTFCWLVVILIGFTIKSDFLGVTSIARGVGLLPCYYTCMLHFFTSTAVSLDKLQFAWINIVFRRFNCLVKINGRYLLVGDGIKVGKEGKKMPAVKWLHQESESNSKAEYIMGHSIQAVSVIARGQNTYFSVPLTGKIHEGIRLNCNDSRTLLDKMFEMLLGLNLSQAFYFVADKYYGSGRFMKQLISSGTHIITMMKKGAVAYHPIEAGAEKKRRGRPRKYGKSVKLFDLFNKTDLNFITAPLPGNPQLMIEYCVMQLVWRPLGDLAKFVLVRHPIRGFSIAMSTDLTLDPLDIIFCYTLRFKIEVMFKQAVHQIGAFMYRFWLKVMKSTARGHGDSLLHFAPAEFKENVLRKINAYHLFIQLGFIAQGLMQYLSLHDPRIVWENFGTWLRTVRDHTLPSEKVVAMALGRTYFEFLFDGGKYIIFKKFLYARIDTSHWESPDSEEKSAA
jgi:DDE superfamily endonuclease